MWPSRGRPKSACTTCKSQKVLYLPWASGEHNAQRVSQQIRCSGERPICKRCARLLRNCVYTTTTSPERSLRFILDSRNVDRRTRTSSNPIKEINSQIHNSAGQSGLEGPPSTGLPAIISVRKDSLYLGISESLMYTLVDVYFESAYNSSLLLHKGRFLESLVAGTVEAHLILSVCAYAAK